MKYQRLAAAAVALSFLLVTEANAQPQPLVQLEVAIDVDSGPVDNPTEKRAVIYATAVEVPNAAWLRLAFDDDTRLGATPRGGAPTVIRITSVDDGASQTLNARHLKEWKDTSAYFNGGVLLIEIIADPGAAESRLAMSRAMFGPINPVGQQTICGATDDRLPSDDPRTGRLEPAGCTAWLIDDKSHCLLTAGHCTGGGSQTMEFNVPLSDGNGNPRHPGPEDQYTIDQSSMQTNGGQGVGDDWAYFGCFANTETGLTPAEAQGFFVLTNTPPPVSGQDIRITGYGTTGTGVPREWNGAQKTHTGPYASFTGSTVRYMTDTTGGNSGSPVIDEETGFAIGIHTHGGCNTSGGNAGTGSNNTGLRIALASPCGVCQAPRPANDQCATPEAIGDTSIAFDTTRATTDGGTTSCGVVAKDVWYEYTASCTGAATASTCDADFDTRIAVYAAGDCGGAIVACNDDSCGEASSMTFPVAAGQQYLIRVGGRNAVGLGTLVLGCAKGCVEDLDNSGAVDFGDILAILGAWGNAGGPEDLDGSGFVDFGDLLVVLGAWGVCS